MVWLTLLTELPCIAGQAGTGEGIDPVQTRSAVQTRVGVALIYICRPEHRLVLSDCLSPLEGGAVNRGAGAPISQYCPVNPGAQRQMSRVSFWKQDPPLWHGLYKHGSRSAHRRKDHRELR